MFFINQNNYDLNKNIVAKCLMQQVGLKTKKMFLFFLHEKCHVETNDMLFMNFMTK